MYRTTLILNRNHRRGIGYGHTQSALINDQTMAAVKDEVTAWPGYEPTPLVALDGLAAASGVDALWCKYEAPRFDLGSFKPVGATYAMLSILRGEIRRKAGVEDVSTAELLDGTYASITEGVTVAAPTSGNHGRALAWGARLFHCRCVIYMSEGVSTVREQIISSFGAEVVRVTGSFDRAVARAVEDATQREGFFIVGEQETVYPDIPLEIIRGYALVGEEIADQMSSMEPPSHVFVPAGSGSMSSAICGRLWDRFGSDFPRFITVEPEVSTCLQESARIDRPAEIPDAPPTIMDGLVVNVASQPGWTILREGAFAFLSVEDQAAIDAMRQAAGGDPALAIGDTGSAAWAGFLAASKDPELRRQLELTESSCVVVVVSEGATDPEVYREIVGVKPEAVVGA